jgi:type I restriction-modification system DNA methylase subunit/sulfur carrier protein ThiS
MSKVTYNERSWAIDIISEISLFGSKTNKFIKRAGGESTINTGSKRLFPDVLLYGEHSDILMGWELKMPDTAITDKEFIDNAQLKAEILGLNGFLLWNATNAVLYAYDISAKNYNPIKNWETTQGVIKTRKDVLQNRAVWITSLHEILKDLNTFFEDGIIKKRPFVESFKDSTIVDFILQSSALNASELKKAAAIDSVFGAEANVWWRISKHEYPTHEQWDILAEIILVNWINKILFANILTAFHTDAKAVYSIDFTVSPSDASTIFQNISERCDFWNIFQPQIGEKYILPETWNEIVQLNLLLKDIELSSIGQELLQNLLENVIYTSKRKVSGQYTTPMRLARLLIHLVLNNKTETIHDPCCGTGTIPRAAYDIKKEAGITAIDALSSIFASDKVSFPLQMATLAISEPMNIGQIIQIFKQDCTDISVGQNITLRDPYDGSIVNMTYNRVNYIASNLPFIQQEDLQILNPDIKNRTLQFIQERSGTNLKLDAKSDLYAYLPFYFWDLLTDNGTLGIVISNSWLGTDWGEKFKEILVRFFYIDRIVTSGSGRWFNNADVVTNILILRKKSTPAEPSARDVTQFITVSKRLELLSNEEIQEIYENIVTKTDDEYLSIQEYKTVNIMGIPLNWNALFSDTSWLNEINEKIIYCSALFEINRGERRGWNPMFYPEDGNGIENEYIKPVLKTPKDIQTLIAVAESDAFCCSKNIDDLKDLNHNGALSWIARFEHGHNKKGEPLVESLERAGSFWYEMNGSTMADLVASMNFNQRIFIAKLNTPSFVDQRLTRFTKRSDQIDIDLTHALLNSLLGIFFIESLGFGRGLGVLDLSSTRIKDHLRMLNPELLTAEQVIEIKERFFVVRDRDILPIQDELIQEDRIRFDDAVLRAYGLSHLKDSITNSFFFLYNMRCSVR